MKNLDSWVYLSAVFLYVALKLRLVVIWGTCVNVTPGHPREGTPVASLGGCHAEVREAARHHGWGLG